MTLRLDSPAEAAAWCARVRAAGESLGFVPTMGALHAGHLSLVERALADCARACVSVFVNPLQFDDPGDLARYPRDLAGDARLLESAGCSMVFTGTLAQFFPGELRPDGLPARGAWVDPGPGAAGLEGERRPGHFRGVATIVARLFELVQPERAYFGQKDFQQCLVVRELAARRGWPEVVVCPTVREASGLALSSRNARLSQEERARAAALARALGAARAAWSAGERDPGALAAALARALAVPGLEVEYAEVRDPDHWTVERPARLPGRAVALVAARVGGVRLIDNLPLSEEEPAIAAGSEASRESRAGSGGPPAPAPHSMASDGPPARPATTDSPGGRAGIRSGP